MKAEKVIKASIAIEIEVPEDWDSVEDNTNPLLTKICEEITERKNVKLRDFNFYISTK